jgi:signal transduction histidine kinase/ActR/RegA family two-component response regulator
VHARIGPLSSARCRAAREGSALGYMTATPHRGAERHLLRLMDDMARIGSLDETCDRALLCLHDALGVERGSVLLFDASGVMRFIAWRGLSEAYRAAVDGHSPWRADDSAAEPILVSDAARDPSVDAFRAVLDAEGIGALAFIPLRFGGKLLGKFMLYYAEAHAFSEEEVAIARIVAGHVAFAIEQQRRFRAEHAARCEAETEIARRRYLERQKNMLVQAGLAFSRTRARDEVFRALSGLVVSDFADWCAVHLRDERGEIHPVCIHHADPEKVSLGWDIVRRWRARREPATGVLAAVEQGRPSLIAHVAPEQLAKAASSEEHLCLLQALGLYSAIVVPLALPEQIIGAMTFVTAESRRSYGNEDLAIAESLASRAALALEQARLYSEAQAARQAAEEAVRRLDVLMKAGDSLARLLDPDAALAQLARFVASTLADYCIVYRLDADGSIHRAALAHADPAQQEVVDELVRTGPLRLDDVNGAGAVLRTGEPVLVAEIPAETLERAAKNPRHLRVIRQLSPRSSLIVPLKARERTLGALALATTDHSGRRYGEMDLALALELAARAALLVDNARLYRHAQEANRARDEMLSIVSHDLRSPLHTIVTACELLELDIPTDRRARTRASIRRATRQMSRLLEDLLDVSRIDEGRLPLEREPFGIELLMADVTSLYDPVAESRGLSLVCSASPDIGTFVGDRTRLGQVLSNIVDNALKFTPEGGEIRVTAARAGGEIRIAVADTGRGIPHEQLPHLFDRFWRSDAAGRRGAGLGLAIAKGIADAHGGRIEVESRPGEGSRFTVILPDRRLSIAGAGAPLALRSPGTILVVDDDEGLRKELMALLDEMGHAVVGASHGKQAIELLQRGTMPDLILMDLMMPVMDLMMPVMDLMMPVIDGWDLLSALRSDPRFASIPLVIMSAVDRLHVEATPSHVAGFLKKPFERNALLRLLRGEPI